MLALLKVAAGVVPSGSWVPVSETLGRSKSEKLELRLKVLYALLRHLLLLHQGWGELAPHRAKQPLSCSVLYSNAEGHRTRAILPG